MTSRCPKVKQSLIHIMSNHYALFLNTEVIPTGQSRNHSSKLIDTILSLSHSLESLKRLLSGSQAELKLHLSTNPLASMGHQSELMDRIKGEEASVLHMEQCIWQKEAKL